jgi:hypothetical protein
VAKGATGHLDEGPVTLGLRAPPMGVSCHPSPAGILSGELGKRIPAPWGGSYPRADDELYSEFWAPVRTAGPIRGREKPNEIIVGFSN